MILVPESETWRRAKPAVRTHLVVPLCSKPASYFSSSVAAPHQRHVQTLSGMHSHTRASSHEPVSIDYTVFFLIPSLLCIPFCCGRVLLIGTYVKSKKCPDSLVLCYQLCKLNVECFCQLFWRITEWGLKRLLYLLLSKSLLFYTCGKSQQELSSSNPCHSIYEGGKKGLVYCRCLVLFFWTEMKI